MSVASESESGSAEGATNTPIYDVVLTLPLPMWELQLSSVTLRSNSTLFDSFFKEEKVRFLKETKKTGEDTKNGIFYITWEESTARTPAWSVLQRCLKLCNGEQQQFALWERSDAMERLKELGFKDMGKIEYNMKYRIDALQRAQFYVKYSIAASCDSISGLQDFELLHYHDQNESNADGLPVFFVGRDKEYVILCIRGTQTIDDLKRDLQAYCRNFSDGVAHSGFAEACDSIFERVQPLVQESIVGGRFLRIVGHSLGGAVAALLTLKFLDVYHERVSGVVFGCPPCISQDLVKASRKCITSFVNDEDPIPRLCLSSFSTEERGKILAFLNIYSETELPGVSKAREIKEMLVSNAYRFLFDQRNLVVPGNIYQLISDNNGKSDLVALDEVPPLDSTTFSSKLEAAISRVPWHPIDDYRRGFACLQQLVAPSSQLSCGVL